MFQELNQDVWFDESDIERDIYYSDCLRGQDIVAGGGVKEVGYDPAEGVLWGTIREHSGKSSAVRVKINQLRYQRIHFSVKCTCHCVTGCKHAAALLFYVMQNSEILSKPVQKNIIYDDFEISDWFEKLNEMERSKVKQQSTNPTNLFLIYCLNREAQSSIVDHVSLNLTRILKNGSLSKFKKYNLHSSASQKYLSALDQEIVAGLEFQKSDHCLEDHVFQLNNTETSRLFELIISSERLYLMEGVTPCLLKPGKKRKNRYYWKMNSSGDQRLVHSLGAGVLIVPTEPGYYVDPKTLECGKIDSVVQGEQCVMFDQAPVVKPQHARQIKKQIDSAASFQLPKPKSYQKMIEVNDVLPAPVLYMTTQNFESKRSYYRYYSEREELLVAQLKFQYGSSVIDCYDQQPCVYAFNKKNNLKCIERNAEAEEKIVCILDSVKTLKRMDRQNNYVVDEPSEMYVWWLKETDAEQFVFEEVLSLAQKGFEIQYAEDFPYNFIDESTVEWYSELEPSEYNWFGYELGVVIDDEKVNLLPVLIKALKFKNNQSQPDKKFTIKMPNGKLLPVALEKIDHIVGVITELFDDKCLDEKGKLRLSKFRMVHLIEFNKGLLATQMRWLGDERLKAFGEKINSFNGIKSLAVPKTLKTQLRPYQKLGLNWLQFLRQYDLAGILADDMGLGKTIQIIANFCVEKQNKRLSKPSLIVMPTSLVVNWRLEIDRFAPHLKTLIVHGQERHERFDMMNEHDLVLTTYPLLVRDRKILTECEFYYVILDEAQYIKNVSAQVTQIACQLKAEHRLCLTGTPMENHLGELWSITHFLMPGLLGDDKQFKQLFRRPIEKLKDLDRQKSLSDRIKPFILRRKKQEVITELPEKTEMIRNIALSGAQRDLYETIRLSMHKKVSQAIRAQGLARSHIIILDALLKLRQVCCDPRLLKLDSAKKAHDVSAKLDYLVQMIEQFVTEGRRILLFSQFTSMLKLIEVAIQSLNVPYVVLTGQTKDRATPIEQFQNEQAPLFLISLKAGGTGLNLTAADTVIHYDPWWNPAVETQATDRAHRIGQKKKVFVYKLITSGTVEETILEMQQKKRDLIEGLFQNQQSNGKLSKSDFDNLFKPLE